MNNNDSNNQNNDVNVMNNIHNPNNGNGGNNNRNNRPNRPNPSKRNNRNNRNNENDAGSENSSEDNNSEERNEVSSASVEQTPQVQQQQQAGYPTNMVYTQIVRIGNPLVVMIGIGNYKHKAIQNGFGPLDSVKIDYDNVYKSFGPDHYNYKRFFKRANNNNNNNNYPFRLDWTQQSIGRYIKEIIDKMILNKHDALIMSISCHGIQNENEDCIVDSNGDLIELKQHIFDPFSHKMSGRPRFFFIDCCRGINPQTPVDWDDVVNVEIIQNGNANGHGKQGAKLKGKNDIYSDAYMKQIFATTAGHGVLEGKKYGGYLTRSVCQVFRQECNKSKQRKMHFDKMAVQIQNYAQKASQSNLFVSIPQYVSNAALKIYFEKKK